MKNFKESVMNIVERICDTESINCRSLNKIDDAMEILRLANIPTYGITISEIPLDWDNQVEILFYYGTSDDYYGLFCGIGTDGEFHFDLYIQGKYHTKGYFHSKVEFLFFNNEEMIASWDEEYGLSDFESYFNGEFKEKNDWKVQLYQLLEKYVAEEIKPYVKDYTEIETKQELLCQQRYCELWESIGKLKELLTIDF